MPTSFTNELLTDAYAFKSKIRRTPIVNTARTKTYVAVSRQPSTGFSSTGIDMIVWEPIPSNTITRISSNVTFGGAIDNRFEQINETEYAGIIYVVGLSRDGAGDEPDMYIFYGEFVIATELWQNVEHVESPLSPFPSAIPNHSLNYGMSPIYRTTLGTILFCSWSTPDSIMGNKYRRVGVYYRIAGVWDELTDPIDTENYDGSITSVYLDPVTDTFRGLSDYEMWEFTDSPSPSISVVYQDQTYGMNSQEPDYFYPNTGALSTWSDGFAGTKRVATTTPSQSAYATVNYSSINPLLDDLDYDTWTRGHNGSIYFPKYMVGKVIYDSITTYRTLVEFDSSGNIIQILYNDGSFGVARNGVLFVENSTLIYWGFQGFSTNAELKFYYDDFTPPTSLNVDGILTRGNSTLTGSVTLIDPNAVNLAGNLIRGNSTLAGSVNIQLDTSVSSGNLIRGNSMLSGEASLGNFKKYLLELFSNISKTNAILESLRFEAEIDRVKFPLIGFTIRATLIKTDTEISNIAELKIYMTDAEIVTYNALIGTAVLTINSIYNFGSTSTETTLFSGTLDDLTKRTLSNFIVAKASDQEILSGVATIIPDKVVLLAGSMSRLKFDPTIKPNDKIIIDGSQRIARRVTHYNYVGYNAYTEVYYG